LKYFKTVSPLYKLKASEFSSKHGTYYKYIVLMNFRENNVHVKLRTWFCFDIIAAV